MAAVNVAEIAEAVKAAITAALDGWAEAFDADEVPGVTRGDTPGADTPQRHATVHVLRTDLNAARRASGEVSIPVLSLRVVSHAESIANVREIRRRVCGALEDVALALPSGGTAGPFVFDLAEDEDDDDTGWFGVDHFTFA
ncbi:hypothetical protein [Nocardioides sp.]|uniref:hypothetical protein n=1 Tax=Nocardioides sp. TaxID=35761 RepID=UPI003512B7F6